jgi:hypothetical protein
MPTTRRRRSRGLSPDAIGPEAIAAWKAGDFRALHSLLGLLPCEPSPLPPHLSAYGASPSGPPPGCRPFFRAAYPRVLRLQKELYRVAGAPGEAVR